MKTSKDTCSLTAVVCTVLLSQIIAIPTGGIQAASVTPTWKECSGPWLIYKLGDSKEDFRRAQRLCSAHNATLPYGDMVDSLRSCLPANGIDGYYWLQTCSNMHDGRVFNVTNMRNMPEEEYNSYVCVITRDIKTDLTIQVEDQNNTTYSNNGTKNTFQVRTGQPLNLFCESGLPNMERHLCVKNGTKSESCTNSSMMTWTPENCEDDITVTCEARHCPEDVDPAVQTNVSIKIQCLPEIVSFTSNSRHDTEGTHSYKTGGNVTLTCVTKASSEVTIARTQGKKMKGRVVSRSHTYSITIASFGCDDMGTYYCIAKHGDTQVNRSVNITANESCPPTLSPKETQGEGSLHISLASQQPVTKEGGSYTTMTSSPLASASDTSEAFSLSLPVLIGIVFIVIVLLIAGFMLGVLYCKMTRKHHRYHRPLSLMYYHNGHSNRDSKNTDDEELYSTVHMVSHLGCPNPMQGRGDSQESEESRYTPWIPMERASMIPVEREPSIPEEIAPGVPVDRAPRIPMERASMISVERESSIPEEMAPSIPVDRAPRIPMERAPRTPVEREPNGNLYQNLSEVKCSSTVEMYANLRTLKNMPGPSERPVSQPVFQPAANGSFKANRQNGYHPMRPVSSNTTTGSYISQEGLHYVTVAHSQSSGSKHSSLNRQRDSRKSDSQQRDSSERDSIQYASLDFENSGKYDARKDKRKLKKLKHKRHS